MKNQIKNLITELKQTYPNFKISLARNSYSADSIINIKTNEEIAYYGGDDLGYIPLNKTYHNLVNTIKSKLDCRIIDFIEGIKKCSFEIYF
jgi:hypothetical protein